MAALTLFLLCACPVLAFGEEVGSTDLIERAQSYDGREVIFSGEAIGDILDAGDHVWLNVSDGVNAVGVWVERDLASEIQVAGRYDRRGDAIRVTGAFYRACPDHGGDFDIHAKTVTLVQRGVPVTYDVHQWKVWLAILLTLGAAGCTILVLARADRKLPSRRHP